MNKKVVRIVLIVIILVVIILTIISIMSNKETQKVEEYIPQEEITQEQNRQTIVTLYYIDVETRKLIPEAQLIDVKELSQEPYLKLLEMLTLTPKSDKLQSAIPAGTKINKVELKGDILYVDLSKEFIDNQIGGIEEQNLSIYSIVNTLTELTEINGIKLLIDGEENTSFKNQGLSLKEVFIKID